MREPEDASCARPDDLAVVKACRAPQRDTSSRAEGFGNAKDCPDVAGILQPRQNNNQRRFRIKHVFERELPRPDGCDDSLGMLGILDGLEEVGRDSVVCFGFYLWNG